MAEERRRSRSPDEPTPGERVRRRIAAQPEIELDEESLRALADEGIDPDEVRRLARERRDQDEASIHDRDSARDELEGLIQEDDY
jgi:hypothetical protein